MAEQHTHLFLGGTWAPGGGEVTELVSPHTEEVIATSVTAGPQDVDRAVAAARAAFDDGPWPRLGPAERTDALRRLAALYVERRKEMAALITAEMGSPISFSTFAQATLPIAMFNTFADMGAEHPWAQARAGTFGAEIVVRREPLGVVAAIVPWNMPQFLIAGKLAPALVAGCPIIIKPALETPLDALVLAELVEQLDLPPGVVSVLPGGRDVGAALVRHPGVDKVAFTGSAAAGRWWRPPAGGR